MLGQFRKAVRIGAVLAMGTVALAEGLQGRVQGAEPGRQLRERADEPAGKEWGRARERTNALLMKQGAKDIVWHDGHASFSLVLSWTLDITPEGDVRRIGVTTDDKREHGVRCEPACKPDQAMGVLMTMSTAALLPLGANDGIRAMFPDKGTIEWTTSDSLWLQRSHGGKRYMANLEYVLERVGDDRAEPGDPACTTTDVNNLRLDPAHRKPMQLLRWNDNAWAMRTGAPGRPEIMRRYKSAAWVGEDVYRDGKLFSRYTSGAEKKSTYHDPDGKAVCTASTGPKGNRIVVFHGPDGELESYDRERQKNPELTTDEYFAELAKILSGSKAAMYVFTRECWKYVYDTPDPSQPLLAGTKENHGNRYQTVGETLSRQHPTDDGYEGDCDDLSTLLCAAQRTNGTNAHNCSTKVKTEHEDNGHAFCLWLERRKDGRLDIIIADTYGLSINGAKYPEASESHPGYATIDEAMQAVWNQYGIDDPDSPNRKLKVIMDVANGAARHAPMQGYDWLAPEREPQAVDAEARNVIAQRGNIRWTMILIAAGCVIYIVVRVGQIVGRLRRKNRKEPRPPPPPDGEQEPPPN